MTAAMRSSGPSQLPARPVNLEVTKYGGSETKKLIHWIFQVQASADALLISDKVVRIHFAVSHLKDRAQNWAYSLLLSDVNYFATFATFIAQLKATFLPPNSDFRQRSKNLACTQGKRTIREFVHELRYLLASLADESCLPEVTRVTVFMNGLKPCAAHTQLFRTYPDRLKRPLQRRYLKSSRIPSRAHQAESPPAWTFHMSLLMLLNQMTANVIDAVRRATLPVVLHADNVIVPLIVLGVDLHGIVGFAKPHDHRETRSPSRREAPSGAPWDLSLESNGETLSQEGPASDTVLRCQYGHQTRLMSSSIFIPNIDGC
jgi:hypothetical protein